MSIILGVVNSNWDKINLSWVLNGIKQKVEVIEV